MIKSGLAYHPPYIKAQQKHLKKNEGKWEYYHTMKRRQDAQTSGKALAQFYSSKFKVELSHKGRFSVYLFVTPTMERALILFEEAMEK